MSSQLFIDSNSNSATSNIESVNLVLNPYVLLVDTQYTFKLHVQLQSGSASESYVQVRTNSPPSPGKLVVAPSTGIEFDSSNPFLFTALNWYDDDLPLTYAFGYIDYTSNRFVTKRSRDEQPSYENALGLPAGDKYRDYKLMASMIVFDKLDSNTTVSIDVTVTLNIVSCSN